jgi:hypothetical protein
MGNRHRSKLPLLGQRTHECGKTEKKLEDTSIDIKFKIYFVFAFKNYNLVYIF